VTVLAVDPAGLRAVGDAIRAVRTPAELSAAVVGAAAAQVPDPVAALSLAALGRRMARALVELDALARVVAIVADGFARTEIAVGARFASRLPDLSGADLAGMADLLEQLDAPALTALLDGSPELAQLVVDRLPTPPGSVADRLARLLRSGEPVMLVLLQARELLLGLASADRRRLALLYPVLVSGLASAPVEDRFAATRVLVSAESARLRARLVGVSGAPRSAGERRLQWYAELLTGRVVLTRPDGTRLVQPHQLLAFDARGDGRIEEVFGDVSVARHLAVYVPGTGTSLDRYAGNAERASAFAAAKPDLAVAFWQGADFPDQPQDHLLPPTALWDRPVHAAEYQVREHVLAAAYRDAADRAGPLLARDVAGLRMALPGPGADLTVLGHSYGGSIVGSAEAHGMVVDRVVHISSAGGYVSDVRDYAAGECGTRRFSMTDPDDPIQLAQGAGLGSLGQVEHSLATVSGVLPRPLEPLAVPLTAGLAVAAGDPSQVGHGLDPDLIPSVTRLDTGVRADGHTLVSGHGGMFDPGSTAWRNLLAVMHGDPVRVMEPERWRTELVPAQVHVAVGSSGIAAGAAAPHYVVTRSPYDVAGYQPPAQPSTGRVCADGPSW
jgi:Alpha/beta hydrolase